MSKIGEGFSGQRDESFLPHFDLPPVNPVAVTSMINEIARQRILAADALGTVRATGENPLTNDIKVAAGAHQLAADLLQSYLLLLFPDLDADPVLGAINEAERCLLSSQSDEDQVVE